MGINLCGFRCSRSSEKETAAVMSVKVVQKKVVVTLEELITSSPGFNNAIRVRDDDDYYMNPIIHKQSSSRKIHPSSCDGDTHTTKPKKKDRKSLKWGPDDYLHVEGFALNLFSKADKQDRAGRADLNTAKTFYAASICFEILNQFGELQPDLEQKQKYAAWKAADIRKALEEGRKPIPGPPGGDTDLSVPSSTYNGANDLESSKSDVADLGTRSDLARVDSAARTAPARDSFPQAYDHNNLQHSTEFSQPPSNVMGSPASGIPPQSHHPTDNYSGVDPASRMAPDSDSFPQAYNRDNFQHPASFSRLPSNVMGSPASGIPPQSHHPTDNYSGVDPASRMAPDSDSIPQAYNRDNFQHPASFSRLPSNVMGSPASGIPPQSHHPTDNYSITLE
ncbi:protein HOMOLOG OF MAMMALIAN LYST-INTERACTING PROTEIN 5-like [Salvia miltiorrhiza]|uniref:protein HOMOLOG OF MAMMALIAN LYST-INTERACTING PROTEIN 5-like n=1 Tax=Salvia miltiorrhiza TaxID=226208 RepID=UPI0025AD061D|nr:protein HOMOLOG OF MAMMALIAN LYST-INTERACTING PROTEIN 5-like [Salvia miltiorrhiza]